MSIRTGGGKESHEAGLLCMKRLIGEKQLSDVVPQTSKDLDEI